MGKVRYSIKTTDGNRYEFERDEDELPYSKTPDLEWLVVKERSTTRYFYMRNIVNITEKRDEQEEES